MMTTETELACIELETHQPAQSSVIWLHGLGADGGDFVPIVPELGLAEGLKIRFIFPHAPVMPITINQGYAMRAWYDIYGFNINAKIDEDGIKKSIERIDVLIKKEEARGIPMHRIFLAGFSQGAVIALTTGLHCANPLGGIIALSGYLPEPFKTTPSNLQTPIFIAHGTEDPIVPYPLGKAAYAALKEAGLQVTWHSYPIPHSVCAEEIKAIGNWLQTNSQCI